MLIDARGTSGAVTGETDQNFTTSTTYLGKSVEVNKINFTYPNGTYGIIYEAPFLGLLGINTLDTETLVDSEAYPDTPSAGAHQYGVIYILDDTTFLTNLQFEATQYLAGPNNRTDLELDEELVWSKQ